jgi:copper chaperone CopZ
VAVQTIYHVEGIARWGGADTVAARLSEIDGANHVEVDMVAGTALVTSDAVLPYDRVRSAIHEAGCTLAARAPQSARPDGVPTGWLVGGMVLALLAGFTLAKALGPPAIAQPVSDAATATGLAHRHAPGAAGISGLAVSDRGFTLVPSQTTFADRGEQRLSFFIRDRLGRPVTSFATVHEKPLHLILVRRDLTGFQHVHPVMSADGTWSYVASLSAPGLWRAYADFTVLLPTGAEIAATLGYDITVAGDYRPVPLPSDTPASGVSFSGAPQVEVLKPFDFRVESSSKLERYLGAMGHLVVLRQADLGYVHVHADTQRADGSVRFLVSMPSSGVYRLYFQYQTGGQVRTAEFTSQVS